LSHTGEDKKAERERKKAERRLQQKRRRPPRRSKLTWTRGKRSSERKS